MVGWCFVLTGCAEVTFLTSTQTGISRKVCLGQGSTGEMLLVCIHSYLTLLFFLISIFFFFFFFFFFVIYPCFLCSYICLRFFLCFIFYSYCFMLFLSVFFFMLYTSFFLLVSFSFQFKKNFIQVFFFA